MTQPVVEWYFGGCPECGGNDGYMNARFTADPDEARRLPGPVHVCVCDKHHTAWPIGMNLFSLDDDEDEATWRENARKLQQSYREVKPLRMGEPVPE